MRVPKVPSLRLTANAARVCLIRICGQLVIFRLFCNFRFFRFFRSFGLNNNNNNEDRNPSECTATETETNDSIKI